MLVDLPGYGYAEASKSAVKAGPERCSITFGRGAACGASVCSLIRATA